MCRESGSKRGLGWRRDSTALDPLARPALNSLSQGSRRCRLKCMGEQVADSPRGPHNDFGLGCSERTFFGGTIATADLGPIET